MLRARTDRPAPLHVADAGSGIDRVGGEPDRGARHDCSGRGSDDGAGRNGVVDDDRDGGSRGVRRDVGDDVADVVGAVGDAGRGPGGDNPRAAQARLRATSTLDEPASALVDVMLTVPRRKFGAPEGVTAIVAVGSTVSTTACAVLPNPRASFCYYIQNDALGFGNTAQAVVDTVNPTATIAVTPSGAPNFLRGTVNVTSTSADAGSGVASSVLHAGGVGACAAGPGIPAAWVTTGVADGTYDICNVVTDVATHTATATITVVVDNTVPSGAVVAPAAGAIVGGRHGRAVDRRGRCHCRHPQRAVALGGRRRARQHNIGAAVAAATGGWARVWNTSTVAVAQRPPDGAVTISALVTDMAGNVLTITTPAVVDNTAPDVKAVLDGSAGRRGQPHA